jgi:alpha-tubulin suppressor-like RCC1 family protein
VAVRLVILLAFAAIFAVAVSANTVIVPRSPERAVASGVTDVAAGADHSCAIVAGAARCWGENGSGQLGDGSNEDRHIPVPVVALTSGVLDIEAGHEHTCALLSGGGVECWGRNVEGQLGDETNTESDEPVEVSGLGSGVSAIAAGASHACALTSEGDVKCWGDNAHGQLGDGTQDASNVPVYVSALSNDTLAIGAGDNHTCAITSQAALQCWGSNEFGQIGTGMTSNLYLEPAAVTQMTEGVASVDGGLGHTCARRTDGGIRCWGLNFSGQLGDSSNNLRPTPVTPSGLSSGVSQVDVGQHHSCARLESGAAKCWGANISGKLGDETNDDRNAPVDVSGIPGGLTDIVAGGIHSCAVQAGSAICWGANASGQVGDGTQEPRTAPAGVTGLDTASKPTPTLTPTVTPTPCPTDTGIVDDLCVPFTATPCPDYDGDTTCDGADGDDDNDGCSDTAEQQTSPGSEVSGGRRNDHWFWDFFDVPAPPSLERDLVVSGNDIFAVVGRFNSTDVGVGPFDRDSDPLSTPNPLVIGDNRANYHPAYDRGGVLVGGDVWDLAAANGAVSGTDIFNVIGQFNHVCA